MPSPGSAAPVCPLSEEALQAWKHRIVTFQHQVKTDELAQQGNLFDNLVEGTLADRVSFEGADLDSINPFTLPQQNTEFWRWKIEDVGVAALYFVIDDQDAVLLYVGETVKSNQRWKGEHDCKRYLMNYVSAHRSLNLPVKVNIRFWAKAPVQTRPRQRLEAALIRKWRSPFNKENWKFWGTPFVGET
jgi:hypothetical protein